VVWEWHRSGTVVVRQGCGSAVAGLSRSGMNVLVTAAVSWQPSNVLVAVAVLWWVSQGQSRGSSIMAEVLGDGTRWWWCAAMVMACMKSAWSAHHSGGA
jgi:hypothetical protein